MYIDEDKASSLYAAAMQKVNFSETLYNDTDKKDDAQIDIAIAYGIELFYLNASGIARNISRTHI